MDIRTNGFYRVWHFRAMSGIWLVPEVWPFQSHVRNLACAGSLAKHNLFSQKAER
jgi:hypothetical protein